MAQGDARERKWRRNWWMEWVASTLHTTSEHGVPSITTADAHTTAASSRMNWRPPADLNGLVRFGERRNLVCARAPSRFKRGLLQKLCKRWVIKFTENQQNDCAQKWTRWSPNVKCKRVQLGGNQAYDSGVPKLSLRWKLKYCGKLDNKWNWTLLSSN